MFIFTFSYGNVWPMKTDVKTFHHLFTLVVSFHADKSVNDLETNMNDGEIRWKCGKVKEELKREPTSEARGVRQAEEHTERRKTFQSKPDVQNRLVLRRWSQHAELCPVQSVSLCVYKRLKSCFFFICTAFILGHFVDNKQHVLYVDYISVTVNRLNFHWGEY